MLTSAHICPGPEVPQSDAGPTSLRLVRVCVVLPLLFSNPHPIPYRPSAPRSAFSSPALLLDQLICCAWLIPPTGGASRSQLGVRSPGAPIPLFARQFHLTCPARTPNSPRLVTIIVRLSDGTETHPIVLDTLPSLLIAFLPKYLSRHSSFFILIPAGLV